MFLCIRADSYAYVWKTCAGKNLVFILSIVEAKSHAVLLKNKTVVAAIKDVF